MRRALVATFALVGLVVASLALDASPARIVALDVGQGDAFLVEAQATRFLVDGGPSGARVLRELGEALPLAARRLDVVALTHAHADHATGLLAVVERYEVGLALEPRGMPSGPVADAWRDALSRRAVPLRPMGRGERLRVGAITIDALAPFPDPADPLANLVLRIHAGGLSALFLGDATERGQSDALLRPGELRALVYVPPHHGADSPHASALVAAARPTVALVSAGLGNRYGHPARSTLEALRGVRVLRTDRDGTLEVVLDGATLVCRSGAPPLPRPWGGWLSRSAACAGDRLAPLPRR